MWKLTQSLNGDNKTSGSIVLRDGDDLVTGKAAANLFANQYRDAITLDMSRERVKQIRQQTKNITKERNFREGDATMSDVFKIGELKSALRKLKSKKAPGPDGIHNDMLKHLGPMAEIFLLEIFNQSWTQGKVPSQWKEATIIPILKKGKPKQESRSYRPISLVSCTGKVMERMINERLMFYLESKNLISKTQTGYRKYRNTEDQLAYLTQCVENAFQEKKRVLAVFFDLTSAFDKVWKRGLLYKIANLGVNSRMYGWIKSFLLHRTARVKSDNILSRQFTLKEGVPQGGVLSPTLFLIYIDDIMDAIRRHVCNSLHADDLAIWTASEYTTSARVRIQETVNDIDKWTKDWGLVINTRKTCATLFSLSPKKEKSVYVYTMRKYPR